MSAHFPRLPQADYPLANNAESIAQQQQQQQQHPAGFNPAASMMQINDVLSSIDTKKSEAYRRAISTYTDLVITESNPILYLQFCNYDPWKAATRLCAYWELRYEIFGPERCYKPITTYCTVTGALSQTAINMIELGFCYMLLPDHEGRIVVLSQRLSRQIHKKYDIQPIHKMEVTFYFMHLVAAQPNAISKGCRGVFLMNEKRMYPSAYPTYLKALARASRDCFPFDLVCLHIILAPRITRKTMKPSYSRKLVDSVLPYFWNSVKQQVNFTRLTLDLIQVSAEDKALYEDKLTKLLINKLKLNPNSIPIQAGGSWSWERFKEWMQMQQSLLLQRGFATLPPPILLQRIDDGGNRNTNLQRDAHLKRASPQVSHGSAKNYLPVDKQQHDKSDGRKLRKRNSSRMPSVDAMAAMGALEPLPIWYEQKGAQTTEQPKEQTTEQTIEQTTEHTTEQIVSARTDHLPVVSSKRQRTTQNIIPTQELKTACSNNVKINTSKNCL